MAQIIVLDQLLAIMPFAKYRAAQWIDPLNDAMSAYEIDNASRVAAFLAQIAVESGELQYVQEIASGAAYEGRQDLGNVNPGDGIKYKGRGFIQITGRANYQTASDALGQDFVGNPILLEQSPWPATSAAWWWSSHGLNDLADSGSLSDFQSITRRINGGLTGEVNREAYWATAKKAVGLA